MVRSYRHKNSPATVLRPVDMPEGLLRRFRGVRPWHSAGPCLSSWRRRRYFHPADGSTAAVACPHDGPQQVLKLRSSSAQQRRILPANVKDSFPSKCIANVYFTLGTVLLIFPFLAQRTLNELFTYAAVAETFHSDCFWTSGNNVLVASRSTNR